MKNRLPISRTTASVKTSESLLCSNALDWSTIKTTILPAKIGEGGEAGLSKSSLAAANADSHHTKIADGTATATNRHRLLSLFIVVYSEGFWRGDAGPPTEMRAPRTLTSSRT